MSSVIKGTVVFGKRDSRAAAIAEAMSRVAACHPAHDLAEWLYQIPATCTFAPASWGYPDRWFIHWDQLPI